MSLIDHRTGDTRSPVAGERGLWGGPFVAKAMSGAD